MSNGSVCVVVQARMGSTRLPGKIMRTLAGRPLLEHVVRRLERAAHLHSGSWEVRVATTDLPADDTTELWCQHHQVRCFRGAADDVLRRYLDATADLDPQVTLLRATADNPCYCPRRTAALVHEHQTSGAAYTCVENLSYVVPEAMQVAALRCMEPLAKDAYCREHVTPWFRRPGSGPAVQQLPLDWQGLRADVRLTVDTPAELQWMDRVLAHASRLAPFPSLDRLYAAYDRLAAENRGEPVIVSRCKTA